MSVKTENDFKLGLILSPESSKQLIELAFLSNVTPYQLVVSVIETLYNNRGLMPAIGGPQDAQ